MAEIIRRTSGDALGWKMMSWKPPAYQDSTKVRNVSTPALSGTAYSRSQSTVSPANARPMHFAAMLADFTAMVTPEENTGSRNSPALPRSANPLPHSDFTFAAYPVMPRAGVSQTAFFKRFDRDGSSPTMALSRSVSVPWNCSRYSRFATTPSEQRPLEKGMVQYQTCTCF